MNLLTRVVTGDAVASKKMIWVHCKKVLGARICTLQISTSGVQRERQRVWRHWRTLAAGAKIPLRSHPTSVVEPAPLQSLLHLHFFLLQILIFFSSSILASTFLGLKNPIYKKIIFCLPILWSLSEPHKWRSPPCSLGRVHHNTIKHPKGCLKPLCGLASK